MRQATGLNARAKNGIEWVVEAFGCSPQALGDPRPAVGRFSPKERRRIRTFQDRVLFANSDLSGISIFEEAQDHGVEAAPRMLSRLSGQP